MNIIAMPVGLYQTNCYMVYGEGDKCVLIDPGYQATELLAQVARQGKKLEAILLTHGHFDHVGAVRDIAAETDCKVYICEKETVLPEGLTAGKLYYTNTYDEGDTVEAAGLKFQVLHTPGHTPGGVCLLCEDAIFSGDTLFASSIGRTDFPGGSYDTLKKSLQKLTALEGNFRVFPGHGEDTTLAFEKKTNPYMK